MTSAMLDLLLTRRSTSASGGLIGEPGPNARQLTQILTAAARVPDHKKLAPWRFILFEGAARAKFGAALADILKTEDANSPSPARLELEAGRFLRAPLVVAVISRVTPVPAAPEWEQVLSAGAACQNLCLAANALGFGTNWITEWYGYSAGVKAVLGLAANERVAGFIYIGTPTQKLPDRDRPKLDDLVSRFG